MPCEICRECNIQCCRTSPIITIFDIVRIINETSIDNYDWLEFNYKDRKFVKFLIKKNGEYCIFLKNKLCTIYDSRPTICSVYPDNIKNEKYQKETNSNSKFLNIIQGGI